LKTDAGIWSVGLQRRRGPAGPDRGPLRRPGSRFTLSSPFAPPAVRCA